MTDCLLAGDALVMDRLETLLISVNLNGVLIIAKKNVPKEVVILFCGYDEVRKCIVCSCIGIHSRVECDLGLQR